MYQCFVVVVVVCISVLRRLQVTQTHMLKKNRPKVESFTPYGSKP